MTLTKNMEREEEISFSQYKEYVNNGYVKKVVHHKSTGEIHGEFNQTGIEAREEGLPIKFKTN